MMQDESILLNKEKVMEIIEVGTTRQVAYYFSALQFFKFLTHDKKLTDSAKSILGNEKAIMNNIFKQLEKNELFNKFYMLFKGKDKKEIDINVIIKSLNEEKKGLSESTINRRASTIKSWVEWMNYYIIEVKDKQL